MKNSPRLNLLAICAIAIAPLTIPDQDTPPAHRFEIYQDQNGIQIAVNSGVPRFAGELFEYQRLLELDQSSAGYESVLFRPQAFSIGPGGNFYVPDEGNHRVAVFDASGTYLRDFGGQGRGPGEFQDVSLLNRSEEFIELHDVSLMRTTRYRYDGSLVEVLSYPDAAHHLRAVYRASSTARVVVSLVQTRDSDFFYDAKRYAVIEGYSDTVSVGGTSNVPVAFRGTYEAAGRARDVAKLMAIKGEPVVTYQPGKGILVSTGLIPELRWYGLDGRPVKVVRLELLEDAVTDEERNDILDRADRGVQEAPPGRRESARVARQIVRVPDARPPWEDVQIDEYGYIWLRVPETDDRRRRRGGSAYRVLSPQGEYLGNTRWPIVEGLPTGGHLTGITRDPTTDEPHAVVFRATAQAAGFKYP